MMCQQLGKVLDNILCIFLNKNQHKIMAWVCKLLPQRFNRLMPEGTVQLWNTLRLNTFSDTPRQLFKLFHNDVNSRRRIFAVVRFREWIFKDHF